MKQKMRRFCGDLQPETMMSCWGNSESPGTRALLEGVCFGTLPVGRLPELTAPRLPLSPCTQENPAPWVTLGRFQPRS